jgi:HlyD family secretion protein
MKRTIIISAIIIVIATAAWLLLPGGEEKQENIYTFAEIKRGNLETIISCSGTIEAISTIEVGTQVSGIIDKIMADYNDNVKKGQLLAILDTTNLAASVRDAQANLLKMQAQYEQMLAKFERDKSLYDKKFLSELDYITSKTNVQSAIASLKSAEYALQKAETNLGYAVIRSPIDGKIIDRSVEPGQTVAASFSTPTLFTIAADLSKMRILADVDEGDIGQIKEGQPVKFTVQAYPDRKFDGQVEQIRLQPATEQNVVNYTVVINASNNEQLLLPGMTATVDFYIEQKENVLLMPGTAVRFKPTVEMMEAFQKNMEELMKNMPDSAKNKMRMPSNGGGSPSGPMLFGPGSQGGNGSAPKVATLWFLDKEGKLRMSPAVTGATDGKMTEIVHAMGIEEGTKIIVAAKGTPMGNNFPRMNFGFGGRRSN